MKMQLSQFKNKVPSTSESGLRRANETGRKERRYFDLR